MKLPANDELKKMTLQERQNFITSALTELRDRYDNPRLNKYVDTILKVYLLECGEGIDVDFSKLPKLPDEVLMFNALVQNNDINLIKRYLDEEVMVGSDLDKELNRVFKTVGLTTDNLQGVGTTINLNKLLKCYYEGKMNNFSERLRKCFGVNGNNSKMNNFTTAEEIKKVISFYPDKNVFIVETGGPRPLVVRSFRTRSELENYLKNDKFPYPLANYEFPRSGVGKKENLSSVANELLRAGYSPIWSDDEGYTRYLNIVDKDKIKK